MQDILSNLTVEIVIYHEGQLPSWVDDILGRYLSYSGRGKSVFNLPIDWEGFHTGILGQLANAFSQEVYFSLCYLSDGSDLVYDYEGNFVDSYSFVNSGHKAKKFLKKKMVIVKETSSGLVKILAVSFNMAVGCPYLCDFELSFNKDCRKGLFAFLAGKIIPEYFRLPLCDVA